MFTGLIQDVGVIKDCVRESGRNMRVLIETEINPVHLALGASVACSGCCLTVVEKAERGFWAEVSQETLDCTNLDTWQEGAKINIEPSLRVGDALGGHFVSGHVDGAAQLVSITLENGSHRLRIKPPAGLMKFIAAKGSVALDGISLTVNEVTATDFGVNIIPHTWEHTTLGLRKTGEKLNIEVDLLARYILRAQSIEKGET